MRSEDFLHTALRHHVSKGASASACVSSIRFIDLLPAGSSYCTQLISLEKVQLKYSQTLSGSIFAIARSYRLRNPALRRFMYRGQAVGHKRN